MGTNLANDRAQPLTSISSIFSSIFRSTEKLPLALGSRSQSCWPFCWHLIRSFCFPDRLLARQPLSLCPSLENLYAPFPHLFQTALLRCCCRSHGWKEIGRRESVCLCVGVLLVAVYFCVWVDTWVHVEDEIVYRYAVSVGWGNVDLWVSAFVCLHVCTFENVKNSHSSSGYFLFKLLACSMLLCIFFLPSPPFS